MGRYYRIPILVAFTVIMSTPNIYAIYYASFTSEPKSITMPGNLPGLEVKFKVGDFQCSYEEPWLTLMRKNWLCYPPPVLVYLAVDWNSPSDPDCWFNVYLGGFVYWNRELYILDFWGNGAWTLLTEPQGWCCEPFNCGKNDFSLKVYPLISGKYRFRIYYVDFPYALSCEPGKHNWRGAVLELGDEKFGKVDQTPDDFIMFTHMYYKDEALGDSVFQGGILDVVSDYQIYTMIVTTRREEDIPPTLRAYLSPEGMIIPTPVDFIRNPEGDVPYPECDPEFPVKYYSYKSYELFSPIDLWNYSQEEWWELTRELVCDFYGDENGVGNDLNCGVNVISTLHLDRLNDTTICFIPVAQEGMEFIFRYNEALGLTEENDILFNIFDDEEELLFSYEIPFEEFNIEPPPYNIPGFSYMLRTFPITWAGNINEPSHPRYDHLADPDSGPYRALVKILDQFGVPIMVTNIETFNVLPKIDSVLLTHHPFYPPPVSLETTTLYSVLRTIIDDSDLPAENIRYYAGPEASPNQNPTELGFWVNEYENENYMFRDYYDPEWHPRTHRKFYENNQAQTIPLSNWDTDKFGDLNYTWRVIRDHRATSLTVRYDDIVDTTQSWGNNWAVELTPPTNWREPRTIPYMRLLTISDVNNSKNGFFMQEESSPDGVDAHKLMFAHNWIFPEFNIADWAVSHIGVPYTSGGAYYKIPYIKNDCSGFVTSARIQELDECGPGFLMVGWIPSCDYEDGDFWVPGHTVDFTEHVQDLCEEPNAPWGWQGLLLFIRKHGETMRCLDSPSKHILIVYYMAYDCLRNKVNRCNVIHAPAGYSPDHGRVRYDNAVEKYTPFDRVHYPEGEWDWTFIKFR